MSQSKYPLIEKWLNLRVHAGNNHEMTNFMYVGADVLEARLDEGIKVQSDGDNWSFDNHPITGEKEGLLIGIKPIKAPDTAESLLREIISRLPFGDPYTMEIVHRSKKLLEQK